MYLHFSLGRSEGEGAQVNRGGFKQVCAVPCRCDWPTNCSPGTLGKQSKALPRDQGEIWQRYLWLPLEVEMGASVAQQVGRHQHLPHAALGGCDVKAQQPLCVVWRGRAAGAAPVQGCVSSPCSLCAPPKAKCVFPEPCCFRLCLTLSNRGSKCFEAEVCDCGFS